MKDTTKESNPNNPLITHTGHILSLNESRFIDEYIKLGNATKAYIIAYNKDLENPPKNARQLGAKLMSKVYIAEEIKYRASIISKETIADAQEVMEYFSAVMRGEVADQFGLEASLGERTKCAQELAKRLIDVQQRAEQKAQEQPEIKITLDWARDKTEPTLNSIMARQKETETEEK